MSLPPKASPPVDPEDTPPPFLGSWRRIYWAVAGYLVALIVLFYVFRKVFEP